jgi:O-glycosyl hydrolase
VGLVAVVIFAACEQSTETNHTHEWGEWTLTTPPTIAAQGTETRICAHDSTHKETRNIDTVVFNSSESLSTYLNTLTNNTAATSYKISLNSSCLSNLDSISMNNKYMDIDLSGSTGITSIQNQAFETFHTLTGITLPNGVTSIESSAFTGCSSLTAINVASGNTAYSSEAGVLYDKYKTALIVYPAGRTGAFTIPSSVTSIGEYAFYNCTSLTSIIIPDSVRYIMRLAFARCTSLTSVTFQGTIYWDQGWEVPQSPFDGDLQYKYSSAGGGIGTYTTTNPGYNAIWTKQFTQGSTANATVTVDISTKYQYVRGFGGMAAPSWANFSEINMAEYEKMYNPDTGLGLNIMRIMILSGVPDPDNSDDVIVESSDDIEATMDYYVNGEGNRPNYYEGVKLVNGYGGYILATPWSPPAKWKTNNSIKGNGGTLRTSNYQDYADYLKAYCQHMLDKGAPVYAVSIQNEPNFMASYDGCEWTPEEMRDFFKQVGRFTDGVKGWGGGKETPVVLTMNGESVGHPNINDAAMDDPVSRVVIDLLGRHTYGYAFLRYAKALDVNPKKEVWMTDHLINSGYPNYIDSTWNYVWLLMNDVDLSIRQNDESAFIWYALKRIYSIIGTGEYETEEGAILPRGYGLSHYAKFAKEMWRCGVAVSGTTADGTALSSGNVNPSVLSHTTTHARVTGFVSDDDNTISLVMYTPTNIGGSWGVDMGTVKIQLPQGFYAKAATAMRSTAEAKAEEEDVVLSADKNSAFVQLPMSNILSVRFTK